MYGPLTRSCPPWSGTCLGTAGNAELDHFPFTFGDLVVRHIADFVTGYLLTRSSSAETLAGRDQACKQTGHQYKTCEPAQKPLHLNSPSGIGTRRPAGPVREHYKSKPRLSLYHGSFCSSFHSDQATGPGCSSAAARNRPSTQSVVVKTDAAMPETSWTWVCWVRCLNNLAVSRIPEAADASRINDQFHQLIGCMVQLQAGFMEWRTHHLWPERYRPVASIIRSAGSQQGEIKTAGQFQRLFRPVTARGKAKASIGRCSRVRAASPEQAPCQPTSAETDKQESISARIPRLLSCRFKPTVSSTIVNNVAVNGWRRTRVLQKHRRTTNAAAVWGQPRTANDRGLWFAMCRRSMFFSVQCEESHETLDDIPEACPT